MTLGQKLLIFALAVAVLPLAGTGFSLIHLSEQALRERIEVHQQAAAIALAAKVSQAVEELARRIASVVELVDVTGLTEPERQGLLRMVYRQSEDISVAILTNHAGVHLAPPEFISQAQKTADAFMHHPPAATADVLRLQQHLPGFRDDNAVGSVLMSPVYFPTDRAARVAVAVPARIDAGRTVQALAGVEIALRRNVLRMEGIDTGPLSTVYVVDAVGKAILHPKRQVGEDLSTLGAVAAFLGQRSTGSTRYSDDGEVRAAAFSTVGQLGWGVVVEQPEAVAFAAANTMRQRTLFWICVTAFAVVALGILFVARLRSVFRRLTDGANAFGSGELNTRIALQRTDEIGQLAQTMNQMAGQLGASYAALENWNRTLEKRVEERTRELQETQAQLLQQSKLAAIGQLGAGVAHEVNNPLTGILGYVQLLMMGRNESDPLVPRLLKIEEAAKRCKVIVDNLLRFSERGLSGQRQVNPNDIVKEASEMVQGGYREADIELRLQLASDVPTIHADPGQIALVLVNILNNAKAAIEKDGTVTILSTSKDGGAQIQIRDTGDGIEPEHLDRVFEPFFTTKKVWSGPGLGLSVAYRIVTDHGGTIAAASELQAGSTFTVWLPVQPPVDEDVGPSPAVDRHRAITLK